MNRRRKIALITTTRADWGILSPLASALDCHPLVDLTILAGNMHLLPRYGMSVRDIEEGGYSDVRRLKTAVFEDDDTPFSRAVLAAETSKAAAIAFKDMRPDLVIMLGDRFEMLAIAQTAAIMTIPIVHLHGGEISEGANDDSFRHAISKLASLHLVATEKSRERLLAMGEQPDRVTNTGALGVRNALSVPVMTLEELNATLDGFEIEPDSTILVTYHPVTLDPDGHDPRRQFNELVKAFDRFPELKILITYPNNDAGGKAIIDSLEDFGRRHPEHVKVVPNLGMRRFMSALRYVRAMVGNSSSGILEAPSAGVPTIDIGTRQQGRERAPSVVNVAVKADEIEKALKDVLGQKRIINPIDNPYFQPDTLEKMVEIITTVDPESLNIKHFNDITQTGQSKPNT